MIDKREILEAASSLSLLPNVVEKDYVLGWILAGINAHEELSESWVFKGGTCLKKCYFETYRFSEDLDFTRVAQTLPCRSASLVWPCDSSPCTAYGIRSTAKGIEWALHPGHA